ncbi:MAG: NIPSNAP family protein [Phycisphaerae bacterium]|nr:NIPSNAP family protein [Phycisphaerae bacterium]
MKRRDFLAASATAAAAGLLPLAREARAADATDSTKKDIYELRLYKVEADSRIKRAFKRDVALRRKFLDAFLGEVMVPALNRIGISPVGAFEARDGKFKDVYVLLRHGSAESVVTTTARLLADEKFVKDGAPYLELPQNDPLYTRVESTMMLAFDDLPKIEAPDTSKPRIFQMRIYESHSMLKGVKKVEMFNTGWEIALFRKCGMSPVFFGQSVAGPILPNLTYMLAFADTDAQKAAWGKFMSSPEWSQLKSDPQYKETVSHITNLEMQPTSYSQV